jgi:hypothetical protein
VKEIDERLFYRILTVSGLLVSLKLIYDAAMHLFGL